MSDTVFNDPEDAAFLNKMTFEDFKVMSIEGLQVFLSLRKKSPDGDYEILVHR